MFTKLVEQDERKNLLGKSEKQNWEVYYYVENERVFSVCLLQNGTVETYGSFSLKSVAKQMCYWLSGQLMSKQVISKQEFAEASLEYGTYQWQL